MSATVNGKHELKNLVIDPEAVDPEDVEMLQDMIVAAVNEAMRAADADAAGTMSKLTGGPEPALLKETSVQTDRQTQSKGLAVFSF